MVFASMRARRLFFRARAVINFLMRAASTLEITNDEQQANVVLHQVIWLTLSKQDTRRKGRQHNKALSRFIPSSLQLV